VNQIDTAQYYGPDVANELIREARDDLAYWLPSSTPGRISWRPPMPASSWPVGGRVVGSRPSAPLVMPWLLLVHHEDLAKGDRSPVARR
jgi:hypothetical protein